jgi:thiamine biosynthesis lipoprotein
MALALVFYIGSKSNPYQVLSGKVMGTYYNVKIKTDSENNLLNSEVKALLDGISGRFSVFDVNSELSKINNNVSGEWMDLSPEMSEVMKKAYEVYVSSDGAFDPTVGKLVNLWGFGVSNVSKTPTDDEVAEALEYTGFNKVKFTKDYDKVLKTSPNIYINLSAIAKGYVVDKAAELLENMGYENFIVEIGGEIRAKGKKSADTDGWVVGVLKPLKEQTEAAFTVTISDMAVATSGDYRNYYYSNGDFLSHTIDTKTGYPVKNNISSVTVFDESCTKADAAATAIMAMGHQKGLAYANSKNLKVIIFVKDAEDNFSISVSASGRKFLDANM